jgi:hypothetical protein
MLKESNYFATAIKKKKTNEIKKLASSICMIALQH